MVSNQRPQAYTDSIRLISAVYSTIENLVQIHQENPELHDGNQTLQEPMINQIFAPRDDFLQEVVNQNTVTRPYQSNQPNQLDLFNKTLNQMINNHPSLLSTYSANFAYDSPDKVGADEKADETADNTNSKAVKEQENKEAELQASKSATPSPKPEPKIKTKKEKERDRKIAKSLLKDVAKTLKRAKNIIKAVTPTPK